MGNISKTLLVWTAIFAVFIGIFWMMNQKDEPAAAIEYSEFYQKMQMGEVSSLTVKGEKLTGEFKKEVGGGSFSTVGPVDLEVFKELNANNVKVTFEESRDTPLLQLLFTFLPIMILIFFIIFFLRQMQNSGGKAMSFGKSRARMFNQGQQKVTFADVAGIEEAKEELWEVIDFLKDPKKFTRLGGRIPKGVLLVGPPGTGKTLLARAIAGEAGAPFLSISGSDFVEMFVGVGASRVRDLFLQAKKHAPCIIFIDEMDAVGRQRGAGLGGGHDEREQTLNQLLVEMDGFESNEGVIMIAATNRPDVLDPALLRPGRFDRQVVVPRPDVKGRLEILEVHAQKTTLEESVNLELLAKGTPGFSGADLENLVNEAALIAARSNKEWVEQADLETAKDKVLMGIERRSMVISEEEKRLTAYHESGHALIARLVPGSDPVHKVTIIPRGRALGVTQQLPAEDKYTISKTKAENDMVILLGGRAAEEVALNEQTSGAGNDIERSTELARKMVCEWGMSEKLGPLTYGDKDEEIFLGRELHTRKLYSEKTADLIDQEVREIVTNAYNRAVELIRENRDQLEALALALLEYESLDAREIELVLKGEKLKKPVVAEGGPSSRRPQPAREKKPKTQPAVSPKPEPVGGEA